MTAIACWIGTENSQQTLWLASDSRVSTLPSKEKLFDSGAKIFPITIQCRKPDPSGMFQQKYYSRSIGFAYAGNALIGLSTASLFGVLASNLAATSEVLPDLGSVARLAAHALGHVTKDLGTTYPELARCEALVCGYCAKQNRFRMFRLTPDLSQSPLTVQVRENSQEEVLLLGSYQEEIGEEINKRRAVRGSMGAERAPKDVLEEAIKLGRYSTIGGHLQLGMDTGRGFQIYSSLAAKDDEEGPRHLLHVMGYEIPRPTNLEDVFVSITGMA